MYSRYQTLYEGALDNISRTVSNVGKFIAGGARDVPKPTAPVPRRRPSNRFNSDTFPGNTGKKGSNFLAGAIAARRAGDAAKRSRDASTARSTAQARAAGKSPDSGSAHSGEARTRATSAKLAMGRGVERKRQQGLTRRLNATQPRTGLAKSVAGMEASASKRRPGVDKSRMVKSVTSAIGFQQDQGRQAQATKRASLARQSRLRAAETRAKGRRSSMASAEKGRSTAITSAGDRSKSFAQTDRSRSSVAPPTPALRSRGNARATAKAVVRAGDDRAAVSQAFQAGAKRSGAKPAASPVPTPKRRPTSSPAPQPAQTNEPVSLDKLSFGKAFAAARKKHGGDGGTFTWRGKKFTTNRA